MTTENLLTDQVKIEAQSRDGVATLAKKAGITGKRFHFIGAGGVGMSGLAKLFLKYGVVVSGSDQEESQIVANLCRMGADIRKGHCAENVDSQTDIVVISAAVQKNNPELIAALSKGCEIRKYAQMLGMLCDYHKTIAVSGTHGKSTTGGWLVHLLDAAKAQPNYIIGAKINQLDSSSGTGNSQLFVAEACEYDRSFLNIKPAIACILNIEADHLDYYKDEQEIIDAFEQFALGVKPGGVVIANGDDPNVAKVIASLNGHVRCETFGFAMACNFSARNINEHKGLHSFDVYHNEKMLGRTRISLPGEYNILNALAVIAMAVNAGIDAETVLGLLGGFTGMDRRCMFKWAGGGITVVDDYAHHPTEIRASLKAIRQKYEPERLWCIFQPHQYSRTRFLLDDFAESFKLADITIVPEIYFVRDTAESREQVNSHLLVERIKTGGSEARFIDGFGPILEHLKVNVKAGDLVVTMGAGDIWKVADGYIHWLKNNS